MNFVCSLPNFHFGTFRLEGESRCIAYTEKLFKFLAYQVCVHVYDFSLSTFYAFELLIPFLLQISGSDKCNHPSTMYSIFKFLCKVIFLSFSLVSMECNIHNIRNVCKFLISMQRMRKKCNWNALKVKGMIPLAFQSILSNLNNNTIIMGLKEYF